MSQTFKPDKKYFLKVLAIQLTVSIIIILAVILISFIIDAANGDPAAKYVIWLITGTALIIMWIVSTIVSYLWIKNLEYQILSDRIKIYQGILTKTQKNIPFRMVTDFAQVRTLYDRMLGIGSIKIQTAGQSTPPTGYEGKLGGLTEYDKWQEILREQITLLHPGTGNVSSEETTTQVNENILKLILNELKTLNNRLKR